MSDKENPACAALDLENKESIVALMFEVANGVTSARRAASEIMASHKVIAPRTSPKAIEIAKARLDESASAEILNMVGELMWLAENTNDYAEDKEADGFILTAEEIRQRAEKYEMSAQALCEIWNDGSQTAQALGLATKN